MVSKCQYGCSSCTLKYFLGRETPLILPSRLIVCNQKLFISSSVVYAKRALPQFNESVFVPHRSIKNIL